MLEILYENGIEDPNITECKWKHFFDNYHEAKTEAKKATDKPQRTREEINKDQRKLIAVTYMGNKLGKMEVEEIVLKYGINKNTLYSALRRQSVTGGYSFREVN